MDDSDTEDDPRTVREDTPELHCCAVNNEGYYTCLPYDIFESTTSIVYERTWDGQLQCRATATRYDSSGNQSRIPEQCSFPAVKTHRSEGVPVCDHHEDHQEGEIYEQKVIVRRNHELEYRLDHDLVVRRQVPWREDPFFYESLVTDPDENATWEEEDYLDDISMVVHYTYTVECEICYLEHRTLRKLNVCGHEFCRTGLLGWIRSGQDMCYHCPKCRRPMGDEDDGHEDAADEVFEDEVQELQ